MKIDLSVIMPSIRPEMLVKAYESFLNAWDYSFEWIVVSPYALPAQMQGDKRIKWIQDWGNPNRAKQIGLVNCEGQYVTWGVDDGVYIENSLSLLYHRFGFNETLSLKYLEGVALQDLEISDSIMKTERYYDLNYHHSNLRLPKDTKVLSFGILPTTLLKQTGGWDCEAFEGQAMADCDLSIRLNKLGHKIIISPKVVLVLKHVPERQGDHAPIHDSQKEADEPRFYKIYTDSNSSTRTTIPIDNWKNAPARWERRFNQEPLD